MTCRLRPTQEAYRAEVFASRSHVHLLLHCIPCSISAIRPFGLFNARFPGATIMSLSISARNSDVWRLFTRHVLLCLLATSIANGLEPNRKLSQYGHTAWRIQDGAIPPPIAIAQTTDRFLWIATAQGLMRFDGVRFMRWQPPQGQNLPGAHFTALLGARDGSLWIGTTRGLARWKGGQLRTYTDLEHPVGISAIIEDDSGTIWATRYGPYAHEAPLCSISEETLRCFGRKEG